MLYDTIGPGSHLCHWCGVEINWCPTSGQVELCSDHLDSNRANNAPENLVPSCRKCNSARIKPYTSLRGGAPRKKRKTRAELQAEVDQLRAEVERLMALTATS